MCRGSLLKERRITGHPAVRKANLDSRMEVDGVDCLPLEPFMQLWSSCTSDCHRAQDRMPDLPWGSFSRTVTRKKCPLGDRMSGTCTRARCQRESHSACDRSDFDSTGIGPPCTSEWSLPPKQWRMPSFTRESPLGRKHLQDRAAGS